jgi:hypothetical protein
MCPNLSIYLSVCLSVCLSVYLPTYLPNYLSIVLQPFVGPGPLFQFLNPYTVGRTPWTRGISLSQGLYQYTEQHKHRINAHTDIHVSSEIRTDDAYIQTGEDDSCLRPRGHCDRPSLAVLFTGQQGEEN